MEDSNERLVKPVRAVASYARTGGSSRRPRPTDSPVPAIANRWEAF
jgi:hypothetical protein